MSHDPHQTLHDNLLTRVANDGCALQFASETLCNDRGVVLTAVAARGGSCGKVRNIVL